MVYAVQEDKLKPPAFGRGMTDLSSLVSTPGAVSLHYTDPAFPTQPMVLHAARPLAWHAGMPVVFLHHGVKRNGADYRDYWLPHVDTGGVLAISIEFPERSFPEYLWYNFGNLRAKDGAPVPRTAWTFGVDCRLFTALRGQRITTGPQYGLFGHSAGGQYVHRMLSFGYRDNVMVAVTANAGTYAMPDLTTDWPWGLGSTDISLADLPALLSFPLTIMAGTKDTKTTGRFFPHGPKAMRQGATRYERAHTYFAEGKMAAARLSVPFAWTLIDVQDVGHDGRGMTDAAAPLIMKTLRRGATLHNDP